MSGGVGTVCSSTWSDRVLRSLPNCTSFFSYSVQSRNALCTRCVGSLAVEAVEKFLITFDYVKHRLQSKFGERCFSYAAPAAWNSLPHSIKLITDTSRFKQLLKSHLFNIAFWHFVSAPGQFVSRALQVRICICICIYVPVTAVLRLF